MKRFEGQVAMVVGAGRGIGNTVAAAYAREGAKLAMFDVIPEIDAARDALAQQYPDADPFAGKLDITDLAQCQNAARAVVERYGRIDVLAVIAGVLQKANPVTDLPVEDWDRVMNVNLKGPFLLSKAVVPYMKEHNAGSIVNIASWWGHSGHAFFSAYCASKAGLIVFTQAMADELAPFDIRVNAVCPGNINTDMHKTALEVEARQRGITFEEMKAIEWAKIPLKKAGDPEDIADAVLFLSSREAKYITGASLDVNGGVLFR